MRRGFGNTRAGKCVQTCLKCHQHNLCEHNLRDASVSPSNVCSGLGGDCNNGERFSCISDYCNTHLQKNKGV